MTPRAPARGLTPPGAGRPRGSLPRRATTRRSGRRARHAARRFVLALAALLVALLAVLGSPSSARAALPAAVDGQALPSLAPMLERVMPGVVNIATRGAASAPASPLLADPFFRRFFDLPVPRRQRPFQSLGSGVIVDAEAGFIVTNNHVVADAAEIAVTLHDGRRFTAELVGTDPDTDVAVIRIPPEKLVAVPLADSRQARVGDFVVAIGNPFGLGQTVTSGIVSALGRSGLGIEGYEDFIQTDASINPGNSGGALVDLRGRLVGINTAIIGPAGGNVGIGFAIPTALAMDVMRQLVDNGSVRRGLLGVATRSLDARIAAALGTTVDRGALVLRLKPGSPAVAAGLEPGDVIVRFAGRDVATTEDLGNAIGLAPVGQPVELTVVRDGEPLTVEAQLVDRAVQAVEASDLLAPLAGATLAEPVEGEEEGVLVSQVARGSPAWHVGLRAGDRVVAVNRTRIRRLDELRDALGRAGRALALAVRRGGATLFLVVD
ncbi:MAG: Do family serine endopeptidase [Ectothiorhodospiraceae bacterium]|nr:Do family serine endopeptidase [Chromatiales bacterium]MCP5153639.1 Do family serine endopeptidase [Ectothiorhodospiraceae bacterium]